MSISKESSLSSSLCVDDDGAIENEKDADLGETRLSQVLADAGFRVSETFPCTPRNSTRTCDGDDHDGGEGTGGGGAATPIERAIVAVTAALNTEVEKNTVQKVARAGRDGGAQYTQVCVREGKCRSLINLC